MRIILDSNVYVRDFRLDGIAFSNLFDFVRKTRSTIVLFRIVREEVVHRYVERFTKQVQETAKSWKAFRYLMLDSDPGKFHKPEIKYQVRELRKRLRTPSKNVEIEYCPDVLGVDINEVALRGIKRTAPASTEGEELRDVIIWFQILASAKSTGEPTIFVTDDGGFWNGSELNEQIKHDIAECGTEVEVYRDLDTFIKAKSPHKHDLARSEAARLVPASSFIEVVLPALRVQLKNVAQASLMYELFGGYGGDVSVTELQLQESAFLDGAVYEIDSSVSFLTFRYEYKAEATLKLGPARRTVGTFYGGGFPQGPVQGIFTPTQTFLTGFHSGFIPTQPFVTREESAFASPSVPEWMQAKSVDTAPETSKPVTAFGIARFSARMIDGIITERVLEEFKLTRIEVAGTGFEITEVLGRRGPWLKATPEESQKAQPDSTERQESHKKEKGG
jgi:hypothetical protein